MAIESELRATVGRVLSAVKRDRSLASRLRDDTDLLSEVGLDSLELTELMLQLEDELQIELNLQAIERDHLTQLRRFELFLSR
jgi:acyl carrier protein